MLFLNSIYTFQSANAQKRPQKSGQPSHELGVGDGQHVRASMRQRGNERKQLSGVVGEQAQ